MCRVEYRCNQCMIVETKWVLNNDNGPSEYISCRKCGLTSNKIGTEEVSRPNDFAFNELESTDWKQSERWIPAFAGMKVGLQHFVKSAKAGIQNPYLVRIFVYNQHYKYSICRNFDALQKSWPSGPGFLHLMTKFFMYI